MSKNEYIKYGTKRTRREILKAGSTIRTNEGIYFVNEDSAIDIEEEFCESRYEPDKGFWWMKEKDIKNIRPLNEPAPVKTTEPEPEPVPNTWHRFLVWLGVVPKIPQAKVVERS